MHSNKNFIGLIKDSRELIGTITTKKCLTHTEAHKQICLILYNLPDEDRRFAIEIKEVTC